ncbi:MAG: PVC-type heme-binding CxxCH protein, partial [Candidatus Hydrogenedentota bacterium]
MLSLLSICFLACLSANPAEILSTIQLDPNFQIELVAMEPAVMDPVDIEFDEQGRLFAIEMMGYPFPDSPGNIVLLKDTDGDGVYETRQVFATGFAVANSLAAWHGGLLVTSPPNIEFVKDTDGDDVADVHEVMLEGFAVGNPQHNVGGLTYGLDNWIYASNGDNSGSVYWPGDDQNKVPMRYCDVRFDLGRKIFQRVGRTTGGFKITFDDWGRMFGTHNLTHISQLVFPGWYIEDLPVRREASLTSISDHDEGETARIFPIGVQDTRVNHPEQSGYFSGGCGITHYGGGAFGDAYNGNVFVCDVVLNLVHRDVLSPNGAALKASRKDERVEFLASTDRPFRPVNMDTGPDGALYLVDMHRVVIEHPEWIPDEIEAHLDLNAGKDQGRIFRITPKGGLPRVTPKFDRDNLASVAAQLSSPNQWTRTTAQRLLVEWQDVAAVPASGKLLTGTSPFARLHALWTLDGLHALKDEQVLAALGDAHAGIRENALKLAEPRMKSAAIRKRVESLIGDPDARVRMFAALAIAGSGEKPPVSELIALAVRDDSDQWIRMASAAALKSRAPDALGRLLEAKDAPDPGEAEFLELVSTIAGQLGDAKQLSDALDSSTKESTAITRLARFLAGFSTGLDKNESAKGTPPVKRAAERVIDAALRKDAPGVTRETWRLGEALDLSPTPRQRELLDEARRVVEDHTAAPDQRVAQLAVLQFAPFEERGDLLFALLDIREPSEIQRAAIQQLRENAGADVARRIIANWRTLGRDVLDQAGN